MEASKISRRHASIKASLSAMWSKVRVPTKVSSAAANGHYIAIEDRRLPTDDSSYLLVNDAA
ncbi:hypothetical protein H257_00276 [Aphanomyces astaci]|uniref:Uncharacterized protein n=1 Tax=Aphanomyces astaci TaxID=112090 RepID=W4HA23_APHAT|nr:hypothetical protein H257_00276 [Aphanomyces astaci]ETV88777.1 hypothetical protein H257_00276 [Aphanomyces astaci]|eukprot:XP_009821177.1 hypothetical protein H257_00276 [Aphanomyces astaci]